MRNEMDPAVVLVTAPEVTPVQLCDDLVDRLRPARVTEVVNCVAGIVEPPFEELHCPGAAPKAMYKNYGIGLMLRLRQGWPC